MRSDRAARCGGARVCARGSARGARWIRLRLARLVGGALGAACAASAALPSAAATTYTILLQPSYASHVSGPDGFVGTADDTTPPPLPGDDGIPGTPDDLVANPAGSTTYLRFASLPLGGDYDVFAAGTWVVQSFSGPSSLREATVFDIAATTAQTNGLTGSLSDVKFLPHFVRLGAGGGLTASVTVRTCVLFGSSCVDLVTTFSGGAITRVGGQSNPFLVPGLTASQAAYLAQLETLAPAGWTQIWLLILPPMLLDATNVFGPTGPFFEGGTASGVLALATTDPAPLPPDPDGDGIDSAVDNCPFTPNPGQEDRGGLGTGTGPDGIGDACQCGDVNGDGRVTVADALLITRALLVPPRAALTRPELCDVGGAPSPTTQGCTITDAVLVRRALLQPATASLTQSCAPALP